MIPYTSIPKLCFACRAAIAKQSTARCLIMRKQSSEGRGVIVTYSSAGREVSESHERATRTEIAKKLATLKDYDFAGEYHASGQYPGPVYFVPGDTLDTETATELGIGSEEDLFGGVVPYPFVATKSITHPLLDQNCYAPAGWSAAFARRVHDVVLLGFTAFTRHDARRAGVRLLEHGSLRIKLAWGIGGLGQQIVSDAAELDSALDAMDAKELARYGVTLEHNLRNVSTYSVGQVRVANLLATYCGTQRLTTDNNGTTVYGGSDLLVVRGGVDALLGLELAPNARLAIAQARAYDAAATEYFPGLFASRRNYDVAQGLDADGRWRSGVLEQSWRIGGASAAEVAALEVFRADSARQAVRASSVEVYGANGAAPRDTLVYYRGTDARVGPLIKYTQVEPYGNP